MNNVYLCVYNRKYTNILKNFSYENSIPEFYLQDKFNVEEYMKNEVNVKNTNNNNQLNIENYIFNFCPNDKSIVYIVSRARKVFLVRNYELHNLLRMVELDYTPLSLSIAFNSSFMVILNKGNNFYNNFNIIILII